MTISQKTIKILWAAAAGRCAFPHCQERLCSGGSAELAPFTVGEMAHICGERPGSNRYNPEQDADQRDSYFNLILLCPNHHALIDRKENEQSYAVDMLQKIKEGHEAFVLGRLTITVPKDKQDAARQISAMLAENHEVWLRFGPSSEIARKNPHSSSAHSVWTSERLSTIVPNNRRITTLLENCRQLFSASEQKAISAFLVHARSYERWVQDEVSYEAVSRFPQEFNDMIKRYTDASA